MELIRNYTESDWGQVSEIYDLSKPDEMGGLVELDLITPLVKDDKMLRYFKESRIWVYENEDKINGFIGLKGHVISWLFVHPKHRRQGIARNLLTKMIEKCNDTLKLNVTKNNHAALSLYLSLGFNVYEELEGKMYGKKIPAVRMKRNKNAEPFTKADGNKQGAP
ncbi:MAG: GNAT family N-acetyltransferase [Deltaproteobacteria bacterium]|nr:GNAT family N-acetyltransferase [Deltaproteobacteria bacterium]